MNSKFAVLLAFVFSTFYVSAQSGFVINKAKSIKSEYTPVPKDFKTRNISWGAVNEFCASDSVEYGAWYKFYPLTDQLKVTISTGFNWGNLEDPLIYVAYLDTVNEVETLLPLGCEYFPGSQGDFALEVFGLHPKRKHFLLIGAKAKKQKFALYLTERFEARSPAEEPIAVEEDAVEMTEEIAEQQSDSTTTFDTSIQEPIETGVMIIGRLRKRNGKPIPAMDVELLNDDLEETATVTTDESGVFKIKGVDPDRVNLVRMGKEDANLLVDMFIYDKSGNIIGKPISLGHGMYTFKRSEPTTNLLKVLTDKDLVVMVKRGKSSMTGKVVDRETYLIGRKGVRVGLYTPRKSLLRTAITDHSGMFVFTQLDQEEYVIKVDHDPGKDFVEVVLTDDLNIPYAMSNSNDQDSEGYFRFRKLSKQTTDMKAMEVVDESGFKHHYYTMLSEEEPGIPYELHSIVFTSGSSELSGSNDELDQLARELLESPEIQIKIDGHTDDVGDAERNQRLSLKRAETIKAYLVTRGVPSQRVSCEGFGSTKPIAPNTTEKGRNVNRRVEFSILE